jgi:2,3-dihydroxy-p-cumate/2,3-dihydroxybenzoate 3,4-dioxygenase
LDGARGLERHKEELPVTNNIVNEVVYVRIGSRDIQSSAAFASQMLSLENSREIDGEICFRSDDRLRTLSYFRGDPSETTVGIGVSDDESLNGAIERLAEAGFDCCELEKDQCARRFARRIVQTRDGSNNCIELVLGSFHHGIRFFPSRDAGVRGLHGVGLRSTGLDRDVEFWTVALDARITDRVGDVTYLGIDDLHHRIVLYPSDRNGVLYTAFDVEDLDNIMQSFYFARSRQIPIIQGPGRQAASNQIFLHIEGPEKNIFSFVTDIDSIDRARHRPRQFELSKQALCCWGSVCDETPELRPECIEAGLRSVHLTSMAS